MIWLCLFKHLNFTCPAYAFWSVQNCAVQVSYPHETCLQAFAESLRLKVQYLDTLPQVGSSTIPISTQRSRATMLYPPANSIQLAADSDTLLFSEQGCVAERCGPPRLQAAQYVTDMHTDDGHHDLLPNIALSSWIVQFFDPPSAESPLSLKQIALQQLKSASAGFADTDRVAQKDWLKIVATVAPSQKLTGRKSSTACQKHTRAIPVPGCECSIELPALFNHRMYSIPQVPIVLLDMALKQDVPEAVIHDIQTAFADILSASSGVCITPAANGLSKLSSSGCADTAPGPPPVVAPPVSPVHRNCSQGWSVKLHHGSCSVIQAGSGQALVPSFDAGNSSDVPEMTLDKVEFTKSSCSKGFDELPSPHEWTRGFCMATETHMCLQTPGVVQLVRLVVHVAGPLPMAATVSVDGEAVAWLEKQPAVEGRTGLVSTTQTVDTLLFLGEGCRNILIVYDDGGEYADSPDGDQVCCSVGSVECRDGPVDIDI